MLRASWQVLDEDMRLSELVEEGRVDLPRVAREAGVVLVGVPEWSTSEVGGVLWLHAHVSARVVRSHRAASAEAAAVARAGGSLVVRPLCSVEGCAAHAGSSGLCTRCREKRNSESRPRSRAAAG